MTELIFYEKPGCITNTKQKKMLADFTDSITVRSILEFPWTKSELLSFFKALPVNEWINPNAPNVKSGEVCPNKLTATEALDMMIEQPLLIRRPLIEINGTKLVGFNLPAIAELLGCEGDFQFDPESEQCSHT